MAQPRLTDYFTQRKKGITREGKPATRRGRRGGSSPAISTGSPHKDLPSSSVHEEFVRVVDEAAGLNGGASTVGSKNSPRTPKRTLDGASSTTDASTAKKRQVEAIRDFNVNIPEKVPKKSSRKKLVLPPSSPAVTFHSLIGFSFSCCAHQHSCWGLLTELVVCPGLL